MLQRPREEQVTDVGGLHCHQYRIVIRRLCGISRSFGQQSQTETGVRIVRGNAQSSLIILLGMSIVSEIAVHITQIAVSVHAHARIGTGLKGLLVLIDGLLSMTML